MNVHQGWEGERENEKKEGEKTAYSKRKVIRYFGILSAYKGGVQRGGFWRKLKGGSFHDLMKLRGGEKFCAWGGG